MSCLINSFGFLSYTIFTNLKFVTQSCSNLSIKKSKLELDLIFFNKYLYKLFFDNVQYAVSGSHLKSSVYSGKFYLLTKSTYFVILIKDFIELNLKLFKFSGPIKIIISKVF